MKHNLNSLERTWKFLFAKVATFAVEIEDMSVLIEINN